MFDSTWIREDLGQIEPGPVLAGCLAGIDASTLPGEDRVLVMQARARLVAHFEALLLADVALVYDTVVDAEDLDGDIAFEAGYTEVAAALHLTRRAAESQVDHALTLRDELPQVWQALAEGRIDLRRAKVIDRETRHLDRPLARQIADRVLETASELTTGQLRARIKRLAIQADPDDAQQRYTVTLKERRVVVESSGDGTAHLLGLDLPPDRVAAISARIDYLAKMLRRKGETRTMDQLRADVFLDLLDGTENRVGGVLEIRVDLATLARLEDHPGELGGYGLVIAEIARKVAENCPDLKWRYVATDGDAAVDTGIVRRRPTAAQRRAVAALHQRCVFPGCRMPVVACDLDHRVRWADGGPTSVGNLAPLCRFHHRLKDVLGWQCQVMDDGRYRWTSLLGLSYVSSGRSP